MLAETAAAASAAAAATAAAAAASAASAASAAAVAAIAPIGSAAHELYRKTASLVPWTAAAAPAAGAAPTLPPGGAAAVVSAAASVPPHLAADLARDKRAVVEILRCPSEWYVADEPEAKLRHIVIQGSDTLGARLRVPLTVWFLQPLRWLSVQSNCHCE
jgi:hypothetical protein